MTDAPRKRTPKTDCIEVRFTGVIRLPIKAGDTKTIDEANGILAGIKDSLKSALLSGSELTFTDPKFGKMDAASAKAGDDMPGFLKRP